MTPEELQYFRAQRQAASTKAIAFNLIALCGQLLAVILAQQLPDPSFPVPPPTMAHGGELNAWKDKLIDFYDWCYCYFWIELLLVVINYQPRFYDHAACCTASTLTGAADCYCNYMYADHC